MEWLEGEDLGARLARCPLTVGESLRLVTQVAAALAVAHARQVVHRDLKPSNLFLVGGDIDRVKVLDFGVARLMRGSDLTSTGDILGTPEYMSPEQARGEKSIDARADVFALGSVLFRCVCGRPPFFGKSPVAALTRLLLEEAPSLRQLRPEQPAELDDLVLRMLAKDPAQRPGDARAVLGELMLLPEAVEAGGGAPAPAGSGELTAAERRVVCFVLAATGPPRTHSDTIDLALEPSAVLDATIKAHGAQLDYLADGTAVVTIQGRRVPSDQVTQAARLALALRRIVPRAPMALVTGRTPDAGTVLEAATIDRAARLLQAAPPAARHAGGIRIDDVSAAFVESRFVVEGDELGLLLVGERSVTEVPRTLLGRPTPFVGRERELRGLEEIFAECVHQPSARPVLVTGAPGAGKSRLRQELLMRIRQGTAPFQLWIGRGDPMRSGAPFALLGEAIRGAVGITGTEEPATQRALLRERVARRVPGEPGVRVSEFLGELAGVPFAAADSAQLHVARRDPMLMAAQTERAWGEWLAAECAHQPVLIVLEDLHWGDLPTVKLIDQALKALPERPLMVLGLARPEVHDLFPHIWAERGLQEIHLGEIARRAAERLVRDVLPAAGVAQVDRIVERAGGNAFFLEELCRQVAEGKESALPETVLATVQGRLQPMEPAARRILRAASIFGELFWAGGVNALLGRTDASSAFEQWAPQLLARELIEPRAGSRLENQTEYAFSHALVREAAYAMLTEHDRILGHRLAGEWLEQAGETQAIVLAEHHEQGEMHGRAAACYGRAAEQALAANDLLGAIQLAERGIACGPPPDARGALRRVEGEARSWRGDLVAADRCTREALDLLAPGSELWFRAVFPQLFQAAAAGRDEQIEQLVRLLVSHHGPRGGHRRAAARLVPGDADDGLAGQVRSGAAVPRPARRRGARRAARSGRRDLDPGGAFPVADLRRMGSPAAPRCRPRGL
jgi:hypothetical protein